MLIVTSRPWLSVSSETRAGSRPVTVMVVSLVMLPWMLIVSGASPVRVRTGTSVVTVSPMRIVTGTQRSPHTFTLRFRFPVFVMVHVLCASLSGYASALLHSSRMSGCDSSSRSRCGSSILAYRLLARNDALAGSNPRAFTLTGKVYSYRGLSSSVMRTGSRMLRCPFGGTMMLASLGVSSP